MADFQINRLGGSLAAEVVGLDLSTELSNEAMVRVHRAWLDHNLLVFRDQRIPPEAHLAFARRFGTPMPHHTVKNRHPDHPEILVVSNERRTDGGGTRGSGQHWHSDYSYKAERSTGSILRALEIPEVGGDTMFANLYLAYEALSDTLKALLSELRASYDYALVYERHYKGRSDRAPLTEEIRAKAPPSEHYLVETHPESGRRLLFFDPTYTGRIIGMTEQESDAISGFLTEHVTRSEFLYRHCWRPYDMIMWDNRCTLHCAVADYDDNHRRHMNRITVDGPTNRH